MKKNILITMLLLLISPLFATRFYFAQITDTHWGPDKHNKRISKAINDLNNMPMKIDFVVHTGDFASNNLTSKKNAKKIKAQFNKLKMPIYYVAGNHDIMQYKGQKTFLKTVKLYKKYFSPLNYIKQHQGVALLFYFSEPIRDRYTLSGHKPWKWLEKSLRKNSNRPVIIMQHSPVSLDLYKSSFETKHALHLSWQKNDRERYIKLVNKYGNVRGILAGHFHRDELHWLGKVPFYVSSSTAGYWGRQGSFRIYLYDNGKLSYRTVYIQD